MKIRVDTNKLFYQGTSFLDVQKKLQSVSNKLDILGNKNDWDDIYDGIADHIKLDIRNQADNVQEVALATYKYYQFIVNTKNEYNKIDGELLSKQKINWASFPWDKIVGTIGECVGGNVKTGCDIICDLKDFYEDGVTPTAEYFNNAENNAKNLTKVVAYGADQVVSHLPKWTISEALAKKVGTGISIVKDCVSTVIDNNEEFAESQDFYTRDAEMMGGIIFSIGKGVLIAAGVAAASAFIIGTGVVTLPAAAITAGVGAIAGVAYWGADTGSKIFTGESIQENVENLCGKAANIGRARLVCKYANLVDDPTDYAQMMRLQKMGY